MAKVITYSRTFPAYHPNKGKPTYFVEKILNWFWDSCEHPYNSVEDMIAELNPAMSEDEVDSFVAGLNLDIDPRDIKGHTLRSGSRWKAGDKFSPRVWSGKPYNSKQIIIAPDLIVKKVWSFKIEGFKFFLDGSMFYHQHASIWHDHIEKLCNNDGLTFGEFLSWFKVPCQFDGQIICWDEKIIY